MKIFTTMSGSKGKPRRAVDFALDLRFDARGIHSEQISQTFALGLCRRIRRRRRIRLRCFRCGLFLRSFLLFAEAEFFCGKPLDSFSFFLFFLFLFLFALALFAAEAVFLLAFFPIIDDFFSFCFGEEIGFLFRFGEALAFLFLFGEARGFPFLFGEALAFFFLFGEARGFFFFFGEARDVGQVLSGFALKFGRGRARQRIDPHNRIWRRRRRAGIGETDKQWQRESHQPKRRPKSARPFARFVRLDKRHSRRADQRWPLSTSSPTLVNPAALSSPSNSIASP